MAGRASNVSSPKRGVFQQQDSITQNGRASVSSDNIAALEPQDSIANTGEAWVHALNQRASGHLPGVSLLSVAF